MDKIASLREPMNMPDPHFPIKVHRIHVEEHGKLLFPHHWHEHMEFLFFVAGEASISCSSVPIGVQAGDLIVVNSNELHNGVGLSDNLLYYAVIADLSLLFGQTADAVQTRFITPIIQNRLLFRNKIENDEEIRSCMRSLIHEIEERRFGYELSIKSYLYRLLALLLRHHVATELTPQDYQNRLLNLERFAPVFRHIETHFDQELSVAQLAQLTRLSRFHFSRLFKELTGRTITEYINMTRIDKAEHLLRSTSLTVSEIAAAAGFRDIYYFSRTFKKYKNAPPSALRK
jgi:AraC-like DNA-binding protein